MSSQLDVYNLALSHVSAAAVQSLTERTKEARECNKLYPVARDSMLESHDWGVARKRKVLALLEETYSGWDYAYAWPADCVAPRKIYDATEANNTVPIPYDIGVNDALNRRIILTNEEDAELIYTAKVENVTLFSAMMVDALGYRLAADLAVPLRSDSRLQRSLMSQFLGLVSSAQTNAANTEEQQPDKISDFQKARS